MTDTPTARIPPTSARAIGVVTIVGLLAVTAIEPMAGVGAASGGVLAGAVALATGSRRRVLPAVLLPIGVLGALGSVVLAVQFLATGLLLTAATVPLGAGLAVVLLGGGSATQLQRAGEASLHATVVAGCGTVCALGIAGAGGVSAALDRLGAFPVPGAVGLGAGFVLAGVTTAVALFLVPPGAFTTPRRRPDAVARRRAIAVWTAVALAVAGLVAAALALVGDGVGLGVLGDWLAGSTLLRVLLALLSGLALVLAVVAGLTRWVWHGPHGTHEPVPAVFAGTVCGFGLAVVALVALGGPPEPGWPALFALATILFGVGWLLLTRYAAALESDVAPAAATVVAASLALAGAVVGSGADLARGVPAGAGIEGVAALVAITAGLFVYRLGRFGLTLGREVGAHAATRRTQLVRAGWLGVISVLGLAVAIGGLWTAAVFAPTLSVPATAGVLAGALALLAAVELLLR